MKICIGQQKYHVYINNHKTLKEEVKEATKWQASVKKGMIQFYSKN